MALLRLVTDNVKRIPIGEDGDFIDVRADISKRTFNRLAVSFPEPGEDGTMSLEQSLDMQTLLFEAFVTGWSLDLPVTKDNYLDLSSEAAQAIDTAVAEHFSSLTPDKDDATKSEGPSPLDG